MKKGENIFQIIQLKNIAEMVMGPGQRLQYCYIHVLVDRVGGGCQTAGNGGKTVTLLVTGRVFLLRHLRQLSPETSNL